jgi:hypothetical protein
LHHEGLNRFFELFPRDRIKVLRMFGVEYVVAPYRIDDDNLVLRFVDRGEDVSVFVYAVTETLPRVYLVSRWHAAEPGQSVEDDLLTGTFDPAEEAWVAGRTKASAAQGKAAVEGEPVVFRSERTNDSLDVELDTPDERLLVFLETYYPGWKVTVDGDPRPLQKINGFFQGVLVGPGEHSVRFVYRPWVFNLGMIVSAGSWAAILLFGLLYVLKAGKTGDLRYT